jgi:putative transposase
MDEAHLIAAVRYIEQNPVRARLVEDARDWPWSSARAHLRGRDDGLVSVRPMLRIVPDWPAFLGGALSAADCDAIRAGERTGRPLGAGDFVAELGNRLGRPLARKAGAEAEAGARRGGEISIVSP